MKTQMVLLIMVLFTAVELAGCSSADRAPFVRPSAVPTEIRILPTPSVPNDRIEWNGYQVRMDAAEFTDHFVNEFGSTRFPSPDTKFLWIHVFLKNAGVLEADTPSADHFSVLYTGTEFKPLYAHRQNYRDYTSLSEKIFPDQEVDGWLRFDVPVSAELKDILFVYLPINYQVSVSPSSPSYPWGEDPNFPAFVWRCAQ